MSITSTLNSYPAFLTTSCGVVAVIAYDTAIVAYSGGTIEIKNGFLTIHALRSGGISTSKQKFEKQLYANMELVHELKKLLDT